MDLIRDMLEEDDYDDRESLRKFLIQHKQSKCVPSLRSAAIATIVKDINFWMEDFPEDPSKYLYILSPFDMLSSKDTLDIIKALANQKHFQYRHIHLFFHNNLRKMDLDILSSYTIGDGCLKVLFNRCKNITDLTISSKTKASQSTINQIPVQYPRLEHLKIIKNICMVDFIDLLTTHCKNLKSLLLQHCSKLPNETLLKFQNLKSLHSLKLHQAYNMTCDTLDCVLKSLTNLVQLSLVVCKINFSKFCNQFTYKSIKVLDLSWSDIADRSLATICVVMPNICDLCVSNCKNLTTLSFNYISKLQKLCALNVSYLSSSSGPSSSRYDFNSTVELCLLSIGLDLTFLDLSGMINVCTNVIAMTCPNLRKLLLNHCCYPKIEWIHKVNLQKSSTVKYDWLDENKDTYSLLEVCCNMEVLHITCMYISENELSKVFAGAENLKELKFLPWTVDSNLLGDEFFMNFLSQFYFPCLEVLDLTNSNDKVTKEVVYLILRMYPKLKKLRVVNCDLVEHELSVLKELITEAQLGMTIEVSCAHKNVSRVL